MKIRLTLAVAAVTAFSAAPSSGQLINFPVTPVPMTSETPQNILTGQYGRGLNQGSGEENAFAVGFERAGRDFSFTAGLGFITFEPETEVTLGGQIGFPLARTETFDIGVQGGFSWTGFPVGDLLHFPVGVSFMAESQMEGGTTLTPWFMPRFSLRSFSPDVGDGNTEFDPGISGGVRFELEQGLALSTALDYLLQDGDDALTLGLGIRYTLGQR